MKFHTAPIHRIRQLISVPRYSASSFLGLAAIFLSGAAMPVLAQPVQITGHSPFAGCTADDVGSQPGTNYPESEIEPWIDANPSNSLNLIAGWQQDRWSDGGSRGDISAYSTDGGAHWKTVIVPGTTLCSKGTYTRGSDPWVSIATTGVAYFFTLAFDPDLPNGDFGANALLVNRSFDGGATWETDPAVIIADDPGQVLNDKNSLTADYTNADFAYAAWDRLRDFTLPPSASAKTKPLPQGAIHAKAGAGDGVAAARERRKQLLQLGGGDISPPGFPTFFKGPAYFSRTP